MHANGKSVRYASEASLDLSFNHLITLKIDLVLCGKSLNSLAVALDASKKRAMRSCTENNSRGKVNRSR